MSTVAFSLILLGFCVLLLLILIGVIRMSSKAQFDNVKEQVEIANEQTDIARDVATSRDDALKRLSKKRSAKR